MNLQIKRRVLADQVRRKIRLERIVARELVSVFADARRTFIREFEERGLLSSLPGQQERLRETLARHYRRTQTAFVNDVPRGLGIALPERAGPVIATSLGAWVAGRSLSRASIIMGTARRRLSNAISTATSTLTAETEGLPTRSAIARTAANIVAPMMRRQAGTVARFETQEAAEGTKLVTAQAIAGLSPSGSETLPPVPADEAIALQKTWLNEDDERVREAHVDAGGQIQPVEQPFIVMGQSLMFPGDTSFDATLDNIIGCRCTALYEPRA